jgi:signal transduction histidine kinase/DNA-binding response OmpR family regulator
MAWLLERQMKAGFALALAVLLMLGGVTYRSSQSFVRASRMVDHTNEVLQHVARLYVPVQSVHVAARDYGLTGQERYLAQVEGHIQGVYDELATIQALTADNPEQQQRVERINKRLDARFGAVRRFLREAHDGEDRNIVAREFVDRVDKMETALPLIREMPEEELRLLGERTARQRSSVQATIGLSAVLMLLIAGLLATVYVLVARDSATRRLSAEALSRLNQELEQANRELTIRNEEIQHANKMKSRFLASMSHELRTPLNAIIGFSELLDSETAGAVNEKQKRFLGHIRTGARHLLQLINDILDLAKVEAGQLQIFPEDAMMRDLLSEILPIVGPMAALKKITLEHPFASEPVAVHADRIRLKQVIYNLLSNAIKFTPEGGTVRITAAEDGERYRFAVIDTGVGIRPEDQELIFEEFRQVSESTKGVREGTGLGLAITRRLVEQHGGTLSVESSYGAGSTFYFTMPKAKGTTPHAEPESHRPDAPLVLVVDDEPVARELLAAYLTEENFQVTTAATGPEAVEKARRQQPNVITLDILLANGSGFGTLYDLKTTPETAQIPVVVVSVVDQKKMGLALGASEYLIKPVQKDRLIDAVTKHVHARPERPARVLVVDDDRASLQLAASILESAGFEPQLAEGGAQALSLLTKTSVDAVLLDLMMPGMDGFQFLHHLRDHEEWRDLPVFVVSAKDLTHQEADLLKRETLAFFRKDEAWKDKLLQQIARAVARHEAPRGQARVVTA